jgi:AcrR family transcriptional regulator
MTAGTGKGLATKERIVGRALQLASRDGLDGLTIGSLAGELGLSKSGLFAHFRSKEQLQIEVLRSAADRFTDVVLRPAFQEPRGEPRVRAVFERWLAWGSRKELPGGCIFVAAAAELDDKPGPARDHLVATQRELRDSLAKSARLAVEAGHFRRNLDPQQFAFELHGIVLAFHHAGRLLHEREAKNRARAAFERLVDSAHP